MRSPGCPKVGQPTGTAAIVLPETARGGFTKHSEQFLARAPDAGKAKRCVEAALAVPGTKPCLTKISAAADKENQKGMTMRGLTRLLRAAVGSLAVSSALPAAAMATGSVYVTNYHSDTISQYTINSQTGALTPKDPPAVSTGVSPFRITISPDGKSAYVASFNGPVSQYTIAAATGALSPKSPATVAAGTSPEDVALSPDGQSAYVANYGDNTVSEYNVTPGSGTLTPKTPATVPAGPGANTVTISPSGRYAYVLNSYGSSISQYNLDAATGVLSPMTPATVPTGFNANEMVVSPDGRRVYVTVDGFPEGVEQYSIDPNSGELSQTSTVVPAPNPLGMTFSADGTHAYVASQDVNAVSQYDVDSSTGLLSAMTPALVPAGSSPVWIALSPDNKSAYVTNYDDSTVSQYDVDPISGALSPKEAAPAATGPAPEDIAVGPRPRGANSGSSS